MLNPQSWATTFNDKSTGRSISCANHQEVFENELALASFERGIASAAYDLAIRQRACLGADKLVLGMAVWAVEAGRCGTATADMVPHSNRP